MNEKAGPEILYFEGDLVARLEARIQEQVRRLYSFLNMPLRKKTL